MIIPAQADAEWVQMLDNLGAAALADGDYLMAGYFLDAADWHSPPSPRRSSARVRLAMAGLGRQEAGR